MNIIDMSLTALSRVLEKKEHSSVEVVRACLDRIDAAKELNNFITVIADEALEAAENADAKRARGDVVGPLLGVPIAVKDNICTRGIRTTCASGILKDYTPNIDAEAVARLKRAGAVIIGKTNMDELAMGSTNESSYFGAVKNVLDTSCVAGGSSGGSANCVAACQAFGALGTDTGGSIRQPASFCGVVGLKPTFGSIASDGLIGLAPSLDQIGTITRSCEDALVLFDALGSGTRGSDSCLDPLNGDLHNLTVGVPEGVLNVAGLSEKVKREFTIAVESLKNSGAKVIEVRLPDFETALTVYHIISSAEAAKSVLSGRLPITTDNIRLSGAEAKRRMVVGAYVCDGDNYENVYIKAAKVRNIIKREYKDALTVCDAIVTPTALTTATKLGALSDPQKTHASDIFAAAVSLAGLPAVSVPCGSAESLPIGMQIIGNYGCERVILNIGRAVMNDRIINVKS